MQADVVQAALKRLQVDYVDLVFCHRPDVFTPIEETVRAMNFVIDQGWAFYWGTSEWTAQQITEVHRWAADTLWFIRLYYLCCSRKLHAPAMSQSVCTRLQHVCTSHYCIAAAVNLKVITISSNERHSLKVITHVTAS